MTDYRDPMEDDRAMPGRYVACGPALRARLCHQVCLVAGVGQVWHAVEPDGYVLSKLDVTGATQFYWIADVIAFLRHHKVPARNLGMSIDNFQRAIEELHESRKT